MSRKQSKFGWVNDVVVPIGTDLRSHSGGIVNEEKRTLGNDLVVARTYSHTLDMARWKDEQQNKRDDALWADTMRMLDELNSG